MSSATAQAKTPCHQCSISPTSCSNSNIIVTAFSQHDTLKLKPQTWQVNHQVHVTHRSVSSWLQREQRSTTHTPAVWLNSVCVCLFMCVCFTYLLQVSGHGLGSERQRSAGGSFWRGWSYKVRINHIIVRAQTERERVCCSSDYQTVTETTEAVNKCIIINQQLQKERNFITPLLLLIPNIMRKIQSSPLAERHTPIFSC